ncbi:MAG: sulfite exporter TauE/SafE family protein [Candidatus Sericytochromatia bacterium]
MESIFGYAAATLMGAVLGLIGGGGSILTVPILAYIFHVPATLATAYSLFIVGLTSIFGVIGYARQGLVQFKTGIVFAIPAMLGVFLSRRFLVPALPDQLLQIGGFTLGRDTALLLLFAVMMVVASISMIRKSPEQPAASHAEVSETKRMLMVLAEGLGVGLLTGLIGAGGGFLVIPVLVVFGKLEMKHAVATSLLIIAIKSLVGFVGDVRPDNPMDWPFLLSLSVFTIGGALVGTAFSKKVPSEKLKPIFGWFVLIMGLFILLKEGVGGH